MMKKIILSLMLSTNCMASMPESNIVDTGQVWSITEQDFWDIQKFVFDIYNPVFKNVTDPTTGKSVSWWFEGDWASKVINMYSKKEVVKPDNWNKWTVQVLGGLARRPQLTKEGFIVGLCHEIGHLLGGYPMDDYRPYSSEGQADYYAGHICSKKVFRAWATKYPLKKLGTGIPLCDKSFDEKLDVDACYYAIMGMKSLADTLSVVQQERRAPDIESADTYRTKNTVKLYTPAQCRLDTMIAGLMCDEKVWDDKVIPIKKRNAVCRNRPQCWFES